MSVINTAHPIFDGVVAQLGFDPVSGWRTEAPTIAPVAPKRRTRPLARKRTPKTVEAK